MYLHLDLHVCLHLYWSAWSAKFLCPHTSLGLGPQELYDCLCQFLVACATVVDSGSKAFGLKVWTRFGWRLGGSKAFLVEAQRPFLCFAVVCGESETFWLKAERPSKVHAPVQRPCRSTKLKHQQKTTVRKTTLRTEMHGLHTWFTVPFSPSPNHASPHPAFWYY